MHPDLARLDARLAALRVEFDEARVARALDETEAARDADVAAAHPAFGSAEHLRRFDERLEAAEVSDRARGVRVARVAGLMRSLACADTTDAASLRARVPVACPHRTVAAVDLADEVRRGEVRPLAALDALAAALPSVEQGRQDALGVVRARLGARAEALAHDPDRGPADARALAESVLADTDAALDTLRGVLAPAGRGLDPWALHDTLVGPHFGAWVRGRDRPARLAACMEPLGLAGPLRSGARIVGAAPADVLLPRAHVALGRPRAPLLLLPDDVVQRAPTGSLAAELATAFAVGFAVAPGLGIPPTDPALAVPRQNVVGRALGMFVARLRLDPRWLARQDAPAAAQERLRRAGASALLLALRLHAAAVLDGPATARVHRALGLDVPRALAEVLLERRHPAASLEGAVRGLALARALREAHDEDFGRSPHAAEALRVGLLGHLEVGPAATFTALRVGGAADAAAELLGLFEGRF